LNFQLVLVKHPRLDTADGNDRYSRYSGWTERVGRWAEICKKRCSTSHTMQRVHHLPSGQGRDHVWGVRILLLKGLGARVGNLPKICVGRRKSLERHRTLEALPHPGGQRFYSHYSQHSLHHHHHHHHHHHPGHHQT
jgi:hypothetical protein